MHLWKAVLMIPAKFFFSRKFENKWKYFCQKKFAQMFLCTRAKHFCPAARIVSLDNWKSFSQRVSPQTSNALSNTPSHFSNSISRGKNFVYNVFLCTLGVEFWHQLSNMRPRPIEENWRRSKHFPTKLSRQLQCTFDNTGCSLFAQYPKKLIASRFFARKKSPAHVM